MQNFELPWLCKNIPGTKRRKKNLVKDKQKHIRIWEIQTKGQNEIEKVVSKGKWKWTRNRQRKLHKNIKQIIKAREKLTQTRAKYFKPNEGEGLKKKINICKQNEK